MVTGLVDQGIAPADFIKRGLSIVQGLGRHLSQDGAAVLIYRSALVHDMMVGYATRLGFVVEHHPPQLLLDDDWRALYNTFAAGVARAEQIDSTGLLLPPSTVDPDAPGAPRAYVKVHYLGLGGGEFPRVWGGNFNRVVPGLIVIRKQARRSGSVQQKAPAR